MKDVLGVGVIGSGAEVQATHIPALACLPELFRVVHCFDPDLELARELARPAGARASDNLQELLSDGHVDVVVVTGPDRSLHSQVMASIEAGMRGVLCERSPAQGVKQAREIADASSRARVPVLSGTMHLYDPAMREIQKVWGALPSLASIVRTRAYVAPGGLLEGLSSEVMGDTPKTSPAGQQPSEETENPPKPPLEPVVFERLMLGLAMQDLPFVRMAMQEVDSVEVAELLGFAGYEVVLRSGDRIAEMSAMLYEFPRTECTLELIADEAHARVCFPSGDLASQSGTATLWLGGDHYLKERTFSAFQETRYRAAWRNLYEVVLEGKELLASAESAVLNLELALRISSEYESRFSFA